MSEKILIVDDEPRVVQLVKRVLEAIEYQVIAASNGESGLEMVALEQPDLVLLDILLPHDLDEELPLRAGGGGARAARRRRRGRKPHHDPRVPDPDRGPDAGPHRQPERTAAYRRRD